MTYEVLPTLTLFGILFSWIIYGIVTSIVAFLPKRRHKKLDKK